MEAFIIIDMQEAFIGSERSTKAFDNVIGYINYVAGMFRKAEKPVIVVRHMSEGDTEEYDNVKELHIEKEDLEILKYQNNSFWQTTLEEQLKALDVHFFVLAGQASEHYVTLTYFGTTEHGLNAVILQNCELAETEAAPHSLNQSRPLISYAKLQHLFTK